MVNPKTTFSKITVFDFKSNFRFCKVVYSFQNLVGLELPTKHTLEGSLAVFSVGFCALKQFPELCHEDLLVSLSKLELLDI